MDTNREGFDVFHVHPQCALGHNFGQAIWCVEKPPSTYVGHITARLQVNS